MPPLVRHVIAGLLLAASTVGTSLASHYDHRQPTAAHARVRTGPTGPRNTSCGQPHRGPHAATRPARAVRPTTPPVDKPGLLGRVGHWANQRIYRLWHVFTRSVLHPAPSRTTLPIDHS